MSMVEERQGIGNVPDPQLPTHSKTCENSYNGPQMAVPSHQAQPPLGSRIPPADGSRRRQKDTVYGRRSKENDEDKRGAGGTSAVDKRKGTGNFPVDQRPMCPRMRETLYDSLQMAIHPFQVQPSVKMRTPWYGELRRHHGDTVYKNCLNMNDKSKKKLTKSSVDQNNWSTRMYSPKMTPKAPDKRAQA
jgi:hypothetical protein